MPLQFRLPKDIPMDEYPKPEAYLEEGLRLDRKMHRNKAWSCA